MRPSQVGWRLRYALERRRPVLLTDGEMPTSARVEPAVLPGGHVIEREAELPHTFEDLQRGSFSLLNQRKLLGPPPVEWLLGAQTRDRLWAITLHYHEWVYRLTELVGGQQVESREVEQLLARYLDDWLVRCDVDQPGARALAWNAFAIATRLGWWTRAYRRLHAVGWHERYPELHRRFLESYWKQAAYLEQHLEWDLRANHLLRDAIGLLWAGRFFDHPTARRWLDLGTRLAVEQAQEQVLADGGHFERSPMYHIHVLEDLVTAASLVTDEGAARRLRDACGKMAEFVAWVRHPDGEIPLLNDAAMGAVSSPSEALAMVGAVGVEVDQAPRRGSRHFGETGLVVHHGPRWSVFFDVGPVGPNVQPGHAHADTLTLCASVDGQRLLVDPGTHSYDLDETRRYDRSTRAHNTVCIDGVDSSEVWHIFRVGRRARVYDVRVTGEGDRVIASAWHDGYRHLSGRPRHERIVETTLDALSIRDHVSGGGRHELTGGLLVAPRWSVSETEQGWLLVHDGLRVRVALEGPSGLRREVVVAPYHPRYGVSVNTRRLVWSFAGPLPVSVSTRLEVEP